VNINNYLDQIHFRTSEAERRFRDDVRSLHSSNAAKGLLKSGATISQTLALLEEGFAKVTDNAIVYLGRVLTRTDLDRDELIGMTAQALLQSKLAFKAAAERNKLLSFAPGKRIELVIDEVFERVDQRLTLRLQEVSFGIDDATAPGSTPAVPASDRYVTANDNSKHLIQGALTDLREEARGSNEVAEEDREIVLSEIAAFEATIIQPRISTDLIQRFIDMVVDWTKRTFTTAAIQEVVHRLIAALMKLLA
jgi:hypothetical protein